jgi:hypothetical protein
MTAASACSGFVGAVPCSWPAMRGPAAKPHHLPLLGWTSLQCKVRYGILPSGKVLNTHLESKDETRHLTFGFH